MRTQPARAPQTALAVRPTTANDDREIALLGTPEEISRALLESGERAQQFAEESLSANTRKAYDIGWRQFDAWCQERGLQSMPAAPKTVAWWLADSAAGIRPHLNGVEGPLKAVSLELYLTGICRAHQFEGHASPTHDAGVRAVLAGIRNTMGVRPTQKKAATIEIIRRMIDALEGDEPRDLRDRAVLLVGFAAALRRSEVAGLRIEDLRFRDEGVVVFLQRRKMDQQAEGTEIAVPFGEKHKTCPVRAAQAWIELVGEKKGPLLRSVYQGVVGTKALCDKSVNRIVKRAARLIGEDDSEYGGHSLRSGHATTAGAAGAEEREIMRTGGWESLEVARRYIRTGNQFRETSARHLGL